MASTVLRGPCVHAAWVSGKDARAAAWQRMAFRLTRRPGDIIAYLLFVTLHRRRKSRNETKHRKTLFPSAWHRSRRLGRLRLGRWGGRRNTFISSGQIRPLVAFSCGFDGTLGPFVGRSRRRRHYFRCVGHLVAVVVRDPFEQTPCGR